MTQQSDLINQLKLMTQAVIDSANIDVTDSRKVLRFISKLTQVINQAFNNIYPILIEVSLLRESDLGSDKIQELRREVKLLTSRDYYRDVQLICGQLNELQGQYRDNIEPIINNFTANQKNEFKEVFYLIDQHEGYLIRIVNDMTYEIDQKLDNLNRTHSVDDLVSFASEQAQIFKQSINELNLLGNKILGVSGKEGLLELLSTDKLSDAKTVIHNITLANEIVMGDKFSNISNATINNRSNVNNNPATVDSKAAVVSPKAQKFKDLLANNKTDDCIKQLLAHFEKKGDKDEITEVIMQSAALNELKQKIRFNIISNDEANIGKNKINVALLDIVDRVE
jgi:Effector-associated domain 11